MQQDPNIKNQDKSIYKVSLSQMLYLRMVVPPTVGILLDTYEDITHPPKYAWVWHVEARVDLSCGTSLKLFVWDFVIFYCKKHNACPLVGSIYGICAPKFRSRSSSFHGTFGVFGWAWEFLIRPTANSHLTSKAGLFVPSLSWHSMTKAL